MSSRYRFVYGARKPRGAKPEVVGAAIDRLRKAKGGRVTAHDVVAAAKSATSPLHRFFEWNDRRAAHEHRLEQARMLLRSIEIVTGEDRPPMRAYVVISGPAGEDAYEGIAEVMKDAGKREQVLRRAYAELLSWRDRYSDLREFAALFAVVDSFPVPLKAHKAA